MYAHFYHLAENPFNLTPDPKFHYINESTREAMASILHGIKARKGFVTLIGEAGTGKTTLLKRIVDEIEGETQVVFVFNPGVSFDELLEFICMELGIGTEGARRLNLLDRLNAHLLDQLTEGRNVVVMIDEAQTLDDSVLEELRLLSNLETAKEKILQILLSGQPELEEKLRKPGLRQLRQRVAVRATLKPMRADEIGAYIDTRLRSAGADRSDFFTAGALRKVWHTSHGIPRVVNVVCDNAMMIAFADGKKRITNAVMSEAIRDLNGTANGGDLIERSRKWLGSPLLRYVGATVVGFAILLPFAMSMMVSQQKAEEPLQAKELRSGAAATGVTEGSRARAARRAERRQDRQEKNLAQGEAQAGFDRELPRSTRPSLLSGRKEPASVGDRRAVPALPGRLSTNAATSAGLPSVRSPAGPELAATDSGRLGRQEEAGKLLESSTTSPGSDGMSQNVVDTIRRAELLARSTAARLYSGRRRDLAEAGHTSAPAGKGVVGDPSVVEDGESPPEPGLGANEAGGRVSLTGQDDVRDADGEGTSRKPAAAQLGVERAFGLPPRVASEGPGFGQPAGDGQGEQLAHATASLADATQTLADALESLGDVADPEANAPSKGKASGSGAGGSPGALPPVLGEQVRIQPGDTVWDIAMKHYGTAGPVTLKRIFRANPAIRNPRKLEVGDQLYLPFQKPEQMVKLVSSGSYRVLIASSVDSISLESAELWIRRIAPEAPLETVPPARGGSVYSLYVTGLDSPERALDLARDILAAYGRLKAGLAAGSDRQDEQGTNS